MIYQTLAPYYDALVQDDEATNAWLAFVKKHVQGSNILELACGSGDLAISLAKANYQVYASDISEDMIHLAQAKAESSRVTWGIQDMNDLSGCANYDGILCFCDSLNYIVEATQLRNIFQQVYDQLEPNGCFLFDMHSLDRLDEFAEEYCEDGYINEQAYEWTIVAEDDFIYQNFVFYDEHAHPLLEQHIQKVYKPELIETMLKECGFEVTIYTDFEKVGIANGEKYFFVGRKGNKA